MEGYLLQLDRFLCYLTIIASNYLAKLSSSTGFEGRTKMTFPQSTSTYNDEKTDMAALNEYFLSLLSNIADAIFITNEEGRLIFVSQGIEELLGYTRVEALSIGNIEQLLKANFTTSFLVYKEEYNK